MIINVGSNEDFEAVVTKTLDIPPGGITPGAGKMGQVFPSALISTHSTVF